MYREPQEFKPQALPKECLSKKHARQRREGGINKRNKKDQYDFNQYVKRERDEEAKQFREKVLGRLRTLYYKGLLFPPEEWVDNKEEKYKAFAERYNISHRLKVSKFENRYREEWWSHDWELDYDRKEELLWYEDSLPQRPTGYGIREGICRRCTKTVNVDYRESYKKPLFGRQFSSNDPEKGKPLNYMDFVLTRRRVIKRQKIAEYYRAHLGPQSPKYRIHKVLKWNPIYYHDVVSAPSYYKLQLTFDETNFHMHGQLGVLITLCMIGYNLRLFDLALNEDISYEMHSRAKILDEYAVKVDMIQKIRIKDSEIGSYGREGHFTEYLRRKRYYRC